MALSSQVEINENCVEVSVNERDGNTVMLYTPALDSETMAAINDRLAERLSDVRFSIGAYSVRHSGPSDEADSLTAITARQSHFGRFRHHNAEEFLETSAAVLLGEAGIKLKLGHTPSDFATRQIGLSLGTIS